MSHVKCYAVLNVLCCVWEVTDCELCCIGTVGQCSTFVLCVLLDREKWVKVRSVLFVDPPDGI